MNRAVMSREEHEASAFQPARLTRGSLKSREVYCLTRRITAVNVPHVMRSLFSRMNSVALGPLAQSAGAFLWSGFSTGSVNSGVNSGVNTDTVRELSGDFIAGGAGPLSLSTTIARGLLRLSLLIVVLLGLITFGCGPPV
jgi:hypothetical protein